jgi:RNA polymerase sigma factor (sigma-70 family)
VKATVIPFARAGGGAQTPEISDEALIAACATGDGAALALLFERYARSVRRFCGRLAGAEEADDLLQSTFLAAWSQVRSYRGDAPVRSWLFAIAANKARRSQRSDRRRRSAMELLGLRPVRTVDSAHDEVARRQLLGRLGSALDRLPHDLKVVYVMCEIEDVPGVEAAQALGVRPGTVWRRLHDARKRLLPMIEGEEP